MRAHSIGRKWWAWSALCAVTVGALETLALGILASRGAVEFAALAALFVLAATAIAVFATGLLILVWTTLAVRVPLLESQRIWLVLFAGFISWPLWFAPFSLFEVALAAPSLIGFLAPRFVVPELSGTAVKVSGSGRTAA